MSNILHTRPVIRANVRDVARAAEFLPSPPPRSGRGVRAGGQLGRRGRVPILGRFKGFEPRFGWSRRPSGSTTLMRAS